MAVITYLSLKLTGLADSGQDMLCSNYTRILDSQGNNILKGLIAFDGCHHISLTEASTRIAVCYHMLAMCVESACLTL